MAEAGGSAWVLMTIVGFAILGLALVYGTAMWQKRRRSRTPGSVERAEGPAPKGVQPAGDDRRAA